MLVVYFAAFRVMIHGRVWITHPTMGIATPKRPDYKFGGDVADVFFKPAFVIDRQLRPDEWKADPPRAPGKLSGNVAENP